MGSSPYSSRTQTMAPGDQVGSAFLNAVQDGVVACSDAIDDIEDNQIPPKLEGRTASGNQSDSPAPNDNGAGLVWFEKSTNGTNVVVLDITRDWRQRFVHFHLYVTTDGTYTPGGANDDKLHYIHVNGPSDSGVGTGSVGGLHFTQDGTAAPGSTRPYWEFTPQLAAWVSETVRIFARSSDGALCMRKDAHTADPDIYVTGFAMCSPYQNH